MKKKIVYALIGLLTFFFVSYAIACCISFKHRYNIISRTFNRGVYEKGYYNDEYIQYNIFDYGTSTAYDRCRMFALSGSMRKSGLLSESMWLPGDKVFIASFFNESKDEIHPIEFLSLFPHTQQLLIANYSLTTEEIETLLKPEPITHLSLWDCNLSGNHPLRVDSSRDIDIELKRCTLDQNSLSEILSVSKRGRIALIECTLEKASYGDPTLKSQYDRTGRTYVHFSPEIESAIERTNLKVSKFQWMDEHPK